ncbi:MAG: FtsQ-type POTRA domain-containing protein [Acidobacteria bacterium]|nr:FtsQ-type POTRA domain-containing protein [Acidobacteriota bacterium]
MTSSKGQAGKGQAGGSRGRPKAGGRAGRPFSAGERAETHRRAASGRRSRSASSPAASGEARGRRAPNRSSQRRLPFEGLQASLMARLRPERFARRLVRIGGAILALLLAATLLMVVYGLSHGLRLFALREVVIHRPVGTGGLVTDQEIDQLVRRVVPEGVLRVDLGRIRAELLRNELIREVEVRRLLPDTLSLQVTERVPVALARLEDGTVRCVDEDGSLFGTSELLGQSPAPPLIRGMLEEGENAAGINREYLAAYQSLLADLDRLDPRLSPMVDEILLSETEGARVILAKSGTMVFLGREDYRRRLNLALDLLDAVRRRDLEALRILRLEDVDRLFGERKIRYVNTTSATRITVGLDG